MADIIVFEDFWRPKSLITSNITYTYDTSNIMLSKSILQGTSIGINSPYFGNISGVLVFKELLDKPYFDFTYGISNVWIDHRLPTFINVSGLQGGIISQSGLSVIAKTILGSSQIQVIENISNIMINYNQSNIAVSAGSFISVSATTITRTNERSMISIVSGPITKTVPSATWISYGFTAVLAGDVFAVNFTLLSSGNIRCLHSIPKAYFINLSAQPDANANNVLRMAVGINSIVVDSSITQKREVGASAGQNRPSVECTTLRRLANGDEVSMLLNCNSAGTVVIPANISITDV